MKNTPNIAQGPGDGPPVRVFKTPFMELIDALWLESDEESVARIVGRPDLLKAAQEVNGCIIFAHKGERLAMVSAELARLEIDKLFCEKDE